MSDRQKLFCCLGQLVFGGLTLAVLSRSNNECCRYTQKHLKPAYLLGLRQDRK